MTPAAFLDAAQSIGVTLWDEGGVLRYRGPREAVEKMVPLLREHKPAILAALRVDDGIEVICRAFGIELPKAEPVLVRCCDCASFVADTIGDGLGIGRCAVDGEGARPRGRWATRPALWARGERRCGDFSPKAGAGACAARPRHTGRAGIGYRARLMPDKTGK